MPYSLNSHCPSFCFILTSKRNTVNSHFCVLIYLLTVWDTLEPPTSIISTPLVVTPEEDDPMHHFLTPFLIGVHTGTALLRWWWLDFWTEDLSPHSSLGMQSHRVSTAPYTKSPSSDRILVWTERKEKKEVKVMIRFRGFKKERKEQRACRKVERRMRKTEELFCEWARLFLFWKEPTTNTALPSAIPPWGGAPHFKACKSCSNGACSCSVNWENVHE